VKKRLPSIFIAIYLLCCIVFGGSAQSPWTNLGLQIAGIGLIAWTTIGGSCQEGKRAFSLNVLLVCALLLVIIQLIPLPPQIWTNLPGRRQLVEGFAVLGYPLRPLPISEVPYETVLTLFAAIPAVAAFVATEHLSPSPRYIALAIVVGLIAGILLGALQVAGGGGLFGYLYEDHSPGAIGFFANSNHMGTLLLVGIPMLAALVISARPKQQTSSLPRYGLGLAVFALILVGLFLNGSRAGMVLSIPVSIASIALFPAAIRWRTPALLVSGFSLLVGISILVSNPIAAAELTSGKATSGSARGEIWSTTVKAISDNFPIGTGLGSFQSIYHRYENPDDVTPRYINHVHNDYLEIALELGAPGGALVLLFLSWWTIVSSRVWLSTYGSTYARAATIATAAILTHSFVDFPLRTAAISAIFAACIGLMAQHFRAAPAAQFGERRPTRHVKLG
jgi:O-antigen ligase